MNNTSDAAKLLAAIFEQNTATSVLQVATVGHGHRTESDAVCREAAAHCVANASSGLLKRAFARLGFPEPELIAVNFGTALEMMSVTSGGSPDELNQIQRDAAATVVLPETHSATQDDIVVAEALFALATHAATWSQDLFSGNSTPGQESFDERLAALIERQSQVEQRIAGLKTAAADENTVAGRLLEAASYLLQGGREDVSAAGGNFSISAQSLAEGDEDFARLAKEEPEGAHLVTEVVSELVNELMNAGSESAKLGYLAAGEKETELAERVLTLIEEKLAS